MYEKKIFRRQNVAGIFAYTDWVNYQKWRNRSWQKFCLLKSYGLIKHIVQQMLKTVTKSCLIKFANNFTTFFLGV